MLWDMGAVKMMESTLLSHTMVGVDGVIRQDALGLERVYIQSKRYQAENAVGSAAIREFVGALTGVGAFGCRRWRLKTVGPFTPTMQTLFVLTVFAGLTLAHDSTT
jgi:restriction endonuclease Mrr